MKDFTRQVTIARLALVAFVASAGALLLAQEPEPTPTPPATEGQTEKTTQRLREGTRLDDALGHFKITGDRAMFFLSDESAKYSCLENLNLERTTNLLAENAEGLEWTVSGTLTEYRGSNYLLLSRAILKSKPGNNQRVKRPIPVPKTDRSGTK
jgi:hypothetical protein